MKTRHIAAGWRLASAGTRFLIRPRSLPQAR